MPGHLGTQCVLDFRAPTLRLGARLAENLAGGTQRQLKLHRLFRRRADHDRAIGALEMDVVEPGCLSCAVTTSGFAIENGPGPQI